MKSRKKNHLVVYVFSCNAITGLKKVKYTCTQNNLKINELLFSSFNYVKYKQQNITMETSTQSR